MYWPEDECLEHQINRGATNSLTITFLLNRPIQNTIQCHVHVHSRSILGMILRISGSNFVGTQYCATNSSIWHPYELQNSTCSALSELEMHKKQIIISMQQDSYLLKKERFTIKISNVAETENISYQAKQSKYQSFLQSILWRKNKNSQIDIFSVYRTSQTHHQSQPCLRCYFSVNLNTPYIGLQIKWSRFERWSGLLCCFLGQDITFTVPLSIQQEYKWVLANYKGNRGDGGG